MPLTMKVKRTVLHNLSEQQREKIKTVSKHILFLVVVSLSVILPGCQKNAPGVKATDFVLDKTYLSLARSVNATLSAKVTTCSITVKSAIIRVNYFDGWSGTNRHVFNSNEQWAVNAPTHSDQTFRTGISKTGTYLGMA